MCLKVLQLTSGRNNVLVFKKELNLSESQAYLYCDHKLDDYPGESRSWKFPKEEDIVSEIFV